MGTPPGFTSLQSLTLNSGFVNVIGVVVDYLPPAPTRGTDWQCTFNLADESSTLEGQRVKMFVKDPSKVPPIRGTGDVVILRSILLKNSHGANVLLSNFKTQWTVFYCSDIPTEQPSPGEVQIPYAVLKDATKPTAQEMSNAIELRNSKRLTSDEWTSTTTEPAAAKTLSGQVSGVHPAPCFAPARDKFTLIEDVGANQFYDIVGQVVKMFSSGDRMDLFVTDYTENSLLYNYGAEATDADGRDGDEYSYLGNRKRKKDWKGPKGKYTVTVTLFWPHSSFAEAKIRENDFVFLRNVHIKIGRDGSCRLEGAIHTDRKFPERVDVQKISAESDERVKDVLRRKKLLRKDLQDEGDEGASPKGTKRARKEGDDKGKDLSKSQLKRKRRKQREAELKEQNTDIPPKANPQDSVTSTTLSPSVKQQQQARVQLNEYIACIHPNQPTRRISDINDLTKTHTHTTPDGRTITLPFQNLIMRTKARIIDFYPRNLADFAVRTSEMDCLSDNDDSDGSSTTSQRSPSPALPSSSCSTTKQDINPDENDNEVAPRKPWTWFFTLILEDASDAGRKSDADRIAVHVADDDAEFLLALTAANLRRHDNLLAQLREKMFILWGDLEERMNASDNATVGVSVGARQPLGERDQNALVRTGQDNGLAKKHSRDADAKETKDSNQRISSLPCKAFICCLREYGVRRKGEWVRRFRMFGTNIQ